MVRSSLAVACVAAWLAALPARGLAQGPEPKAAFTDALARFSLALDGSFGDEGPAVSTSLAAMDRIRQQWDTLIRTYESGMAGEIGAAAPALATRMHLALGGTYLDRLRFADARRELGEAIRLDPDRAEALTVRGLIEAQLAGDPRSALDDFQRAAALTPADPVRAYLLARQLLDTKGPETAVNTALERFVSAHAAANAAPDGMPFVRLGLVQEVPGIEPFFPPAPYREGFRLLQAGQYEEALSRLKTAMILDPMVTPRSNLAEPLRLAGAALRNGTLDVAIARLDAAVALAPESPEVHRLLGLAHLANEDADRGVSELRAAVRLDPSYERPRIDLARALFDRNAFAEAATLLIDTLSAIPDSGRARYLLGLTYQRQGNYAGAMEALARAAALQPLLGLNSIVQTIGALRRSQQDYDGAIDAFSQRVALVPNDAPAHHELGDMYFRRSLLAEALAEYTVALMLAPSRPDSYVGVAQVRLREGRVEDAAAAARQAASLDAAHKEARYVLGTALVRLGKTDDGNRELQQYQRLQAEATALQSKRLELGAFRRDAAVSTANGNYDRAVELLRQALDAEPGDPSSELDLGLALLRAGRAAEALAHLKAGAAPGGNPDVHRYLADAYAATGQVEDSRRERALYAQARQDALRRAGAAR